LRFCDNSTRAQSKKINFFSKMDIKKTSFLGFFFINIFEKIIKFSININHNIWVEFTFNDNWRDLKIYDFFSIWKRYNCRIRTFYRRKNGFYEKKISVDLPSTVISWMSIWKCCPPDFWKILPSKTLLLLDHWRNWSNWSKFSFLTSKINSVG
jgi:hypothetical protein